MVHWIFSFDFLCCLYPVNDFPYVSGEFNLSSLVFFFFIADRRVARKPRTTLQLPYPMVKHAPQVHVLQQYTLLHSLAWRLCRNTRALLWLGGDVDPLQFHVRGVAAALIHHRNCRDLHTFAANSILEALCP